jgi:hypothetical protein
VDVIARVAGDLIEDGCGKEFLPAADVHAIANTFAQALFDRHLRGDAAAAAYLGADYAVGVAHARLEADPGAE